MRMDRKTKAEKSLPKIKPVEGSQRAPAPKTNGNHLLAAYERLPIGIVEASLKGKYIDANQEFCRILGYSKKEILRLSIKHCTYKDDYSEEIELYKRLVAGEIPFYRIEKRSLRKDGSSIWVELTRTLVCDAEEKPIYTLGVVLDISERKTVEIQTKWQAHLLAELGDAVLATDDQFVLTSWNKAAESIYGWKAEEVLGRKASDILQTDFLRKTREEIVAESAKTGSFSGEVSQLRKDGTRILIEARSIAIRDEKGTTVGYVSVNRDITERKQAEQSLRESQQLLEATYKHAPIGIVESSIEGQHLNVNEEFCHILGYQKDELLHKGIKDFTHQDDYAIDVNLHQQLVAGKIPFYRLEKRFLRKDGEDVWVELTRSLVRDAQGKPLYTIGAVLDISDRKHVERVLRDSVERLRLATSAARMFMWEWDLQNQFYVADDNFDKVLGFSGGLLPKGTVEAVQRLMPPEDWQTLEDAVSRAVETHSDVSSLQCRFINPETGQVIWLEMNAKVLYDQEGNAVRMLGVTQNITESKEAQDQIEIISRMPEENPNPVMRLTPGGAILYSNPASQTLLGEWAQQAKQRIPRELQDAITAAFTSARKTDVEIGHRGKHFSLTLAPILEAGYVNMYGTDITGRKQAEERLRESEERFRAIVSQATAGITETDIESRITFVNPTFCEMLGYSETELLGRTIWELTYTDDLEENKRLFQRMLVQGEAYQFEKRFIRRDGSTIWTNVSVSTIRDLDGNARGGVGVVIDINERKRAEEALRSSEERMRLAIESNRIVAWEWDAIANRVTTSDNFAEIYGRPPLEPGETGFAFILPEDLPVHREKVDLVVREGGEYYSEFRITRPVDGRTLWLEERATALRDTGGQVNRLVGIVTDITERKRSEEALTEYARQQGALYKLSDQLHRTSSLEDVFNVSLDAIISALGCDRASILLFDDKNEMRFVAWRGLSEEYRKATDGHSPWTPDTIDPEPICMDDVRTADLDEWLRAVILGEGIGSLAFIPLVSNGNLIGKFMIYFNTPHAFSAGERDLSLTIAHQLAFGVDRKRGEEALARERELLERLFDTMPVMVSMIDPKTNSLRLNAEFERVIGWKSEEVTISSLLESLYPDLEYRNDVLQRMAAAAGKTDWVEVRLQARDGRTVDSIWSNISIIEDQKLTRGIALGIDITERKQTEKRLALLAEVSEMLRNFEDPHELMYNISKAVGEHLHVKRALFNEIDLEHDLEIVHRDYHNGWDSVAGVHKISDYSSVTSAEVAAGKTVVNTDSKTDPRTAQDYEKTYGLTGERSYVVVPLMRENRWVASLWVSDDAPRSWSQDDVSLLETIAERTWTVIEKLRINAELRASEERLRATLETTVVGFATLTTDTRFIEVNDAFCRIVGYSREELLGMDCTALTHPDFIESTNQHVTQLLAGDSSSFVLEKPYIRKDGVQIWVQNSVSVLHDTDGTPLSLIVICQDITNRRYMEEQLRAREAELEGIINQTPFMLTRCSRDLRYRFVSHAYAKMIGRTPEEVAGKPIVEIMGEEGFKTIRPYIERVLQGETLEYESEVSFKEVGAPFLHVAYTPDFDEQGNVIGWFASIVDISERRRVEEALRIENERFMRFVNSNIVGILIGNANGDVILANDYYLNLLGVNRQEFLEGKVDWKKFTPPEWLPADEKAIQQLRAHGVCEPYEKEYLRTDGTRVPVYIADAILPGPGEEIAAFVIDISERKRAEEALLRNEKMFSTLIDAAPFGVYFIDSEFRLRAINKGSEAVFSGIHPLIGRDFAEILHLIWQEPFATEAIERFRHTLRTGESFISSPIVEERANIDEIQAYDWQIHRITLADGTFGVVCYFYDLSEQKRMEAAVRASETLYRTIARSIPGGGVYVVNRDFRYLVAEGPVTGAFGLSREMLEGHSVSEVFSGDQAERMEQRLRQNFAGETVSYETMHNGRVYWTQQAPLMDSIGQAIILTLDITERKQAEEALRESEERFRAILRQATAGIVRKDEEGTLIFVNQAFCNMLGYTESELLGRTMWEFLHPDDVIENKRSYERMMMEGVPFKLERRLLRSDGSMIWVDASVSPIMDAQGKSQSAVTIEVDITGRKQAEAELQQLNLQLEERVLSRTAKLRSVNQTLREEITERKRVEEALRQSEAAARSNEEKLRTLFDLLPVGISFLDPEGQIIQMNSALLDILKLSKDQLLNKEYLARKYIRADGMPMLPTEFASARALAEERTIHNVETGILLENGEIIWTNVSAAPVDVADVGVVVVTVDITDSKRAEQALQESHRRLRILSQRLVEVQEDERRALARELHDRVGQTLAALNINLIIINSQLSPEVSEQIGTRLNDSMKLVAETIALVRDVMTDLRPAVLDDYGLVAALESHLAQFMARYDINVKFERPTQPISRLGPSIEMTFLRIAQEALMNIARHAQATQVRVSLAQQENTVYMTIQDNGIGIESWQEANRPGSHGLTIMRERAEAFDGSLRVKSVPGQGTKIELSIPIKGQNEAQEEKNL